MNNLEILKLFPESVFKYKFEEFKNYNPELSNYIYNLYQSDETGITRSNRGGWHSKDFDLRDASSIQVKFALQLQKYILNTFKELGWKTENKKIQIKIINTSFLKKYSYRLEKMARARNYLAKFIKKINLDFVVCVDLDDVISNGINKKEFLNSLQILDKRNDLFGISAISKPYYYDIAGLRIKNYFMKNIYHISKVRKIFKGYILRKKYIYDVQKK